MAKKTSVVKTGAKVSNTKELNEKHKLILEEYFINGYNKSKAVLTICPEVKNSSAACHVFNTIANSSAGAKYKEGLQARLRRNTHISKEQVLNEFINTAYTDATDFIGLSEEELKKLTPSTRRQIQSYKVTERTEVDRKGNEVTIKTIDLKLVNKLDALKETAKIIGAYEIDNKQKNKTIDLSKATPEQLNVLLKLFTNKEQGNDSKGLKTIEV